jgi:hypothetical protein
MANVTRDAPACEGRITERGWLRDYGDDDFFGAKGAKSAKAARFCCWFGSPLIVVRP